MEAKTIRELGGEIAAELFRIPESELPWGTQSKIVDIVMGVLARHSGEVIKNDEDLPVAPLQHS
jgi:hypothetical protein